MNAGMFCGAQNANAVARRGSGINENIKSKLIGGWSDGGPSEGDD